MDAMLYRVCDKVSHDANNETSVFINDKPGGTFERIKDMQRLKSDFVHVYITISVFSLKFVK
jgi:hypothetical protein